MPGTTWVSYILDLLYFGKTCPDRQTSVPLHERVPFLEIDISDGSSRVTGWIMWSWPVVSICIACFKDFTWLMNFTFIMSLALCVHITARDLLYKVHKQKSVILPSLPQTSFTCLHTTSHLCFSLSCDDYPITRRKRLNVRISLHLVMLLLLFAANGLFSCLLAFICLFACFLAFSALSASAVLRLTMFWTC